MNYFELFGFAERPFVNKNLVAERYFELQKKYHPDFYTNENEQQKEMALETSADINKAFVIFKSDEKTAEYFLQQKGIINAEEKYKLPPGFLMEMMELNEYLDEATAEETQKKIDALEEELAASVQSILAPGHPEVFSGAELEQLKEWYYKKKYLKRILDRISD